MVLGRKRAAALFAAFAAAALIAPASASAINPVSFSEVGNLGTPRDAPGAARLPDGRVLVAGGEDKSSNDLDSTEFFNPSTNSFTPGPTMLHTHGYSPVMASLPDGRVLLAGGYDGSEDTPTAEVFNPANGTFSPVGNMLQGRENAPAATLPDGRVFVVGGYANGSTLNSTEFFDPHTNSFSSGPTLPDFNYSPGVAAVAGGRILIAGGYNGNSGTTLDKTFLFDPSTNAFNPISNLPFPIYYPAGASLPQGRALLAGGANDAGDELDTALIFDPTTNSFTTNGIGTLIHKRQEAAAAELADGRVLVVGGYVSGPRAQDTAEVLSVPSNSFKAKLKGRKIIFTVSNEGVASAADSSAKFVTTAKKKKPKLVKTTSKHGGPGKIKVKVKLTKAGSAKLAEKGKLTIKAVYTPDGGLAAVKKLKLR